MQYDNESLGWGMLIASGIIDTVGYGINTGGRIISGNINERTDAVNNTSRIKMESFLRERQGIATENQGLQNKLVTGTEVLNTQKRNTTMLALGALALGGLLLM